MKILFLRNKEDVTVMSECLQCASLNHGGQMMAMNSLDDQEALFKVFDQMMATGLAQTAAREETQEQMLLRALPPTTCRVTVAERDGKKIGLMIHHPIVPEFVWAVFKNPQGEIIVDGSTTALSL